jgi:hypothetical protein
MPQSVIDLRIAGVVAPLEEIPKIIEESIGSLVKSVKEKPD